MKENWTSSDGTRLDRVLWRPDAEPDGWVVAIHGLSCRAEDMEPLAGALNRRGLALMSWNLRGQGLDPVVTRRGSWLDVAGMKDDLERCLDVPRNRPVFLAGESMGALLALQAAVDPRFAGRFSGLLMFSPVVELAQRTPPLVKNLLRGVSTVFPRLRLKASWFVHGSAAFPTLTRIAERQDYLEHAPHRLGPLTIGFLLRMGELIDASYPAAKRLEIPLALFSGGHDVFIAAEQTRRFFEAVNSPERRHFEYPESYHQLLFDLDAGRVVADAADWISARLNRSR